MSSNFNNNTLQSVVFTPSSTSTTTTTIIDDSSSPSLQQRRIEFHLARKPSSYSNHKNSKSNFKLEILNPSSSSSASTSSQQPPNSSSSSSKKSDSSDIFDASFDLDFGFRIPFRRIGAGLENLGNTCFLNSVIQCLTYTEPLVAYLQSGKHQNSCHVAGFCALCAMQKHVNCALKSTGRSLAPKDLVSNLRRISRTFRNARQEDAHEYMIHLLESMHKCCLPSGVPAESAGAYDKSLVHKIFGGRLRSQVKCLQCSHCSNTFDPFLDLSLEIIKADSVHKALMNFTAAEQLDGGERQYKCEKCKQKVRALKQLTVSKAPYVLTIHLKRFRHFSGQKIDKKVSFGSSLNLKQFVSGSYDGDLTYTLYGVLVHAGWSTHSGHYYCFVRTSSGIWYSLDDNRVYEVSEKKVMEQKAYMLFYVRDRKNVGPKKAVDVVHKENMFTTMRNASSPCSIPGVRSFQNGLVDKNPKEVVPSSLVTKQSEGHNASEVLVEQKQSKCVLTNDIALEKVLNEKTRNAKSSASFISKENSLNTVAKDDTVHPTTKHSNGDQSEQCAKATTSSVCPDTDNSREKDIASIEKQSISNCPSSVGIDPCSNDSQVAGTPQGTKVHNSLPNDVNGGKQNVPSDSVIQSTTEAVSSKDGALESVSDSCSALSKPRVKRSRGSSLAKSCESIPRQSLMKEILKSSVGGYLSTKMLYGASLSLRKNKKFKRVKKRLRNVVQEKLVTEDSASADMGPSTSDSNSLGNSKHSQQKGRNTCDTVGESLGVNGKDVSDSCSKEPNSQSVNVNSGATRELEESAVGRWDGVGPPLNKVEYNGGGTLTIGHVLDEWDEEYDRGKRKKVRVSRNSFGGPNVFQEVATKKAKLKVRKT